LSSLSSPLPLGFTWRLFSRPTLFLMSVIFWIHHIFTC
jgi:hypothetical protein